MFSLLARRVVSYLRIASTPQSRTVRKCISSSIFRSKQQTSTSVPNTAHCSILDAPILVEEEKTCGYRVAHYHPARIGDNIHGRYSVIGKLGYGSVSTVWLCHDLHKNNDYVALKVCVNSLKENRQLSIYDHMRGLEPRHQGRTCIRRLLDSFEVAGPDGRHTCLVHEALGMGLEKLRDLVPDRMFAPDLVRQSLRGVLCGMQHEEAHSVHTGEI